MESFLLCVALLCSLEAVVLGVAIHVLRPNVVHKKTLIVIAISLSVIAMCVNPTQYWDLYRQYEQLDAIRSSGIGLKNFLFYNEMHVGGADYASLITYNLVRYLIAYLDYNRLLPFVMTLITYSIWCYITIDWAEEHKLHGYEIIISMMLSGVFMPFIFVNSGLRNTSAAAIAAVAVYNNLHKKHHIRELVVLFFLAFTIHYSTIYIIIIYCLVKICPVKIAAIALFCLTNFVPLIVALFRNSQYEILRKMASSFSIYTENRRINANFYQLGVYVVLIALTLSFILRRGKAVAEKKNDIGLEKFVLMMILNAIFNIGYYEIVVRPLYTFGTLSTPILYFMYGGKTRLRKEQRIFSLLCVSAGLLLVLRVSLPEYLVITYC